MRRRTFLNLSLGACAAVSSLGCAPLGTGMHGTMIVLRHGDRDGPDLNATGRARAAALPAALTGMPIDAIFSPDKQRNIDTVTPLASQRGLDVTLIDPVRIARRMFSGRNGQTLVWVGNKDNLETLWDELGAMGNAPLNYGDLFIVTLPRTGPLSVERRHWGP